MNLRLFLPGFIAFLISLVLMPVMIRLAASIGFTDDPSERDAHRRMHDAPVARGGGLVVSIGFIVPLCLFFPLDGPYGAVLIGVCILAISGTLDDRLDLSPALQLLAPLTAALVVSLTGSHIRAVTNPFNGYFNLESALWFAHLLTVCWIVAMVLSVKILDGIDGLSAGIGVIASATIGAVALLVPGDERTASLAFLLGGVLLGYLPWNWHPARIYYGEAGAMLVGFVLAVTAILSTGKWVVTLMVMAIPLLDMGRVIVLRLMRGRKPWIGGRDHLHHLLSDSGLGVRGTTFVLCLLSGLMGLAAFLIQ